MNTGIALSIVLDMIVSFALLQWACELKVSTKTGIKVAIVGTSWAMFNGMYWTILVEVHKLLGYI